MNAMHDYWSFFAEQSRLAECPLYARLADGVGANEKLKALAAHARPGQPQANMLFGAVHFLLLRGVEHPLRRFYKTLGGRADCALEDPVADFADFAECHREQLIALIATRATNTNEVGRSSVLHAGFRAVAGRAKAPLALIEIGPSAGLNMIWDRYGVRYLRGGETAATITPDAALVIEAALRGHAMPPLGPTPAVASRLGLELNPNDLTDPDNRDWLRALVWPDHVERLARLDAAIALALDEHPPIVFGDALESLLDAIRAAPPGAAVCVYHTLAVYQFSDTMRRTLDDLLTVAGLRRPVYRLGFEWEGDKSTTLRLRRHEDGAVRDTHLAEAHPHGAWLEWLA